MGSILLDLYYGNLCEAERSVKDLQDTKEYKKMDKSYEKLMECLSEEQKKLFNEFYDNHTIYDCIERERIYVNGVKVGMCLGLELRDFDPKKQ